MKNSNQYFKALACSLVLLSGISAYSQNGVRIADDANPPDQSAMFQVDASDQGVLIPQVALEDLSNSTNSPIASPAQSLLVYNTGTVGVPTTGYYYWDTDQWNALGDGLWNRFGAPDTDEIYYSEGDVVIGSLANSIYGTSASPVTEFSDPTLHVYSVSPDGDNYVNGEQYASIVVESEVASGANTLITIGQEGNEINCHNHSLYLNYDTGTNLHIGGAGTNAITGESNMIDIIVNGDVIVPSDASLKTEVQAVGSMLDKVLDCQPMTYRYNGKSTKNCGFMAQDIKAIFPGLVKSVNAEGKDGTDPNLLGINYIEFIPILVKALGEQQAIIDALETRISTLEE